MALVHSPQMSPSSKDNPPSMVRFIRVTKLLPCHLGSDL